MTIVTENIVEETTQYGDSVKLIKQHEQETIIAFLEKEKKKMLADNKYLNGRPFVSPILIIEYLLRREKKNATALL